MFNISIGFHDLCVLDIQYLTTFLDVRSAFIRCCSETYFLWKQGIIFLPLGKNVDEFEKDKRKVPGLFCCSWTWGAQYMCFQRFPVLTFNPHRKGRCFILTHHGSYVYAFLLIPGILFVFLLRLYLLHTFLLLGFVCMVSKVLFAQQTLQQNNLCLRITQFSPLLRGFDYLNFQLYFGLCAISVTGLYSQEWGYGEEPVASEPWFMSFVLLIAFMVVLNV